MSYLKTFFRLLLGLFMTYAGFSHLTFNRQEFVAQVPTWLQFSEGFTDFVVGDCTWPRYAAVMEEKGCGGCITGPLLCRHLPWQHQPVRQSHRCLWTQH